MSVSLEGNPGCSALGHLFQARGSQRVCITCGYVEAATPPAAESADTSDEA